MQSTCGYRLVCLAHGVHSVHALAEGETFHPVIGPVAEAEALYVGQMQLVPRLRHAGQEFVIWDVGLGAAANVLTVLRAARSVPGRLRVVSFDRTLEPLGFALAHASELGYITGYESLLETLLADHRATRQEGELSLEWTFHLGDFPEVLASEQGVTFPKPHGIMFDAFSPARNPAMWTQPLFARMFALLDPARPCVLPTYSRSTLLRVSLLLAGFYVGVGHATGEKEETTLAANTPDLVVEPLDRRWLGRARRSTSAEPLWEPVYRQARLSGESWERLLHHPQFR